MQICFTISTQQESLIESRLSSFKELYSASPENWFSELCFCILTAQAQAKKAIKIQEAIGTRGFLELSQEAITAVIREHGHRFHNKKAEYIILARRHATIKQELNGLSSQEARNYLVKNIKGLGLKEASHFLRNVGYDDVAIIDRHIVRFLVKYNFIEAEPTTITPAVYYRLEELLKQFGLPLSRLDLMIWCHMTGSVLK